MNEWPEGESVSYIGMPYRGLQVGDLGQVLKSAGQGSHVHWKTGSLANQVILVDRDDLVPARAEGLMATAASADGLEDSLDVGVPDQLSLPHLCAMQGPGAVLTAIAHANPSDLVSLPDQIRQFTAERLAATATMREVTAQLDDEEAGELIRLATAQMLRTTFGLVDG